MGYSVMKFASVCGSPLRIKKKKPQLSMVFVDFENYKDTSHECNALYEMISSCKIQIWYKI